MFKLLETNRQWHLHFSYSFLPNYTLALITIFISKNVVLSRIQKSVNRVENSKSSSMQYNVLNKYFHLKPIAIDSRMCGPHLHVRPSITLLLAAAVI